MLRSKALQQFVIRAAGQHVVSIHDRNHQQAYKLTELAKLTVNEIESYGTGRHELPLVEQESA